MTQIVFLLRRLYRCSLLPLSLTEVSTPDWHGFPSFLVESKTSFFAKQLMLRHFQQLMLSKVSLSKVEDFQKQVLGSYSFILRDAVSEKDTEIRHVCLRRYCDLISYLSLYHVVEHYVGSDGIFCSQCLGSACYVPGIVPMLCKYKLIQFTLWHPYKIGLPRCSSGKEPACQCRRHETRV